MENTTDQYAKETVKEKIEIDKDNLDIDTAASICTMIQETLHREATKFVDVLEKLTRTYKKEFVLGDFSVCLAVSDGAHENPIVQLAIGSIPGTLKNLKCLTKGLGELMHDEDTDKAAG